MLRLLVVSRCAAGASQAGAMGCAAAGDRSGDVRQASAAEHVAGGARKQELQPVCARLVVFDTAWNGVCPVGRLDAVFDGSELCVDRLDTQCVQESDNVLAGEHERDWSEAGKTGVPRDDGGAAARTERGGRGGSGVLGIGAVLQAGTAKSEI